MIAIWKVPSRNSATKIQALVDAGLVLEGIIAINVIEVITVLLHCVHLAVNALKTGTGSFRILKVKLLRCFLYYLVINLLQMKHRQS